MPYKNIEDEKAYQKKYHKQWYEKNKTKRIEQINKRRAITKASSRSIVDEIKLRAGCKDCGYKDHAIALDFDHLLDKEYNISSMVVNGYSMSAIEEEMKKCEVVCANCHRIRTKFRFES